MTKIVNLLPKVEHLLEESESLVKPICIMGEDHAEALEGLEFNVLYDPEMYSLFGTDCCGGLAYFGLNKDIKNIQEQADKYLKYFSDIPQSEDLEWEGKFYALWEIGDYSLLILYEDYQDDLENPYPVNSNVLFTKFGAWISDYQLPQILYLSQEEQKMHGNELLVGKEKFLVNNPIHQLLLNKFKDTMKIIWPIFDLKKLNKYKAP